MVYAMRRDIMVERVLEEGGPEKRKRGIRGLREVLK